jgi:hypothetical protein
VDTRVRTHPGQPRRPRSDDCELAPPQQVPPARLTPRPPPLPPRPPLPPPPGYDGKVTDALLASLKVTRYQSSKARITHAEWRAHKAAAASCRGEARGDVGEGQGAEVAATVFA